jgi:hypothetical protein
MRILFSRQICAASAAMWACLSAAQGEIIDRIAVSVGSQVITQDQIGEEIRVTAFLNHEKPDMSPVQKRRSAERLVEQTLIRREIDLSKYPLPPMSDAEQSLEKIQNQFGSDTAFDEALQKFGITEKDLLSHLWWQLTVLHFIDYRFRPGVQVKDADIEAFYSAEVEKWKQQGVDPIPSLDDSRAKIEEILEQQRIDQALDRWLGDTRTQVEIRYHAGAFE